MNLTRIESFPDLTVLPGFAPAVVSRIGPTPPGSAASHPPVLGSYIAGVLATGTFSTPPRVVVADPERIVPRLAPPEWLTDLAADDRGPLALVNGDGAAADAWTNITPFLRGAEDGVRLLVASATPGHALDIDPIPTTDADVRAWFPSHAARNCFLNTVAWRAWCTVADLPAPRPAVNEHFVRRVNELLANTVRATGVDGLLDADQLSAERLIHHAAQGLVTVGARIICCGAEKDIAAHGPLFRRYLGPAWPTLHDAVSTIRVDALDDLKACRAALDALAGCVQKVVASLGWGWGQWNGKSRLVPRR
ncbi:hypothetical protein [Curtobacterium sp. MCLR17_058]|uniref:hypothetical protein n=1 Tax=Curtobacterium sp. MCLR17_058 TaxID=2175635 RepID=UPI0011B7D9B1|nr:hypothetical protein [Curtobacterium sp. MCLR17_058]WIB42668.1 hypothetical protein DEJ11_17820 [Curtobacterium sp. MCLR17_058]